MPEASTRDYVAVIDIGSNAVRFVVYDGLNRAPIKIHNERRQCHLGKTLSTTGRLNPEGVKSALESLSRFAALIRAMKIREVRAVATAAMRDAKDGPAFIQKVKKDFGLSIKVIEGDEEARLSALGVMMNGLGRQGVIGDYGGGSLELIVVDNGKVKHKTSLPIGAHRLLALSNRAERVKYIDAHLDTVSFLEKFEGADFYALGGAWRSMARVHMRRVKHPVFMLDQYTVQGGSAGYFANFLARQKTAMLKKVLGAEQRRAHDIGVAALAMSRVFERLKPKRLVYSGTGLREGMLFDRLSPALQKEDALIASCAKTGLKTSRFSGVEGFEALSHWMAPLFERQDAETKRLVHAIAYLGDIGWLEHEDYQAIHAFHRTLLSPFYGIDHPGRAFMALAQYARYAGLDVKEVMGTAGKLIDKKTAAVAITAGLAQRVAFLLTGGALGLLKNTRLKVTPGKLTLVLKRPAKGLTAEGIEQALQELASTLNKRAAIEIA